MTEPITEPEPSGDEPARTTERWIYGGLRILNARTVHAWLPEPAAGQPLPEELWYRLKANGHWIVGGIYTATVTRTDQRVQLYGPPGPWQQRFENRDAVARLEVLDRSARDQIARATLQRRAANDPALATAIRPLPELAAGLRTDAQVRALLAYVTEQIYAARWRRRPRP
jgi:hypothetical protein